MSGDIEECQKYGYFPPAIPVLTAVTPTVTTLDQLFRAQWPTIETVFPEAKSVAQRVSFLDEPVDLIEYFNHEKEDEKVLPFPERN